MMKQLHLDIVVNEFGASKKYRAMTVLAGQAIVSPPAENETEAVLQLFSSLGNRNSPVSQQIEMSVDIAMSGFSDAKDFFTEALNPTNQDLRKIDLTGKAGDK